MPIYLEEHGKLSDINIIVRSSEVFPQQRKQLANCQLSVKLLKRFPELYTQRLYYFFENKLIFPCHVKYLTNF